MLAYADHNFLINCAKRPDWQEAVIHARDLGQVTIVLSPWSIYEIASAATAEMREELIQIVDEFRPAWILARADVQLREGIHAWQTFSGLKVEEFKPIGTLAEASGHLLRRNPERLTGFTLRDHVNQFLEPDGEPVMLPALQQQQAISAANRVCYLKGMYTKRRQFEAKQRHVAQMLARIEEKGPSNSELDTRINELLTNPPMARMIRFFVKFGGMEQMKAVKIESMLTTRHWQTPAVLNANRQIDRQHAVEALAYCDYLVTSDGELIKRCQAIRGQLAFLVATVQTGEDFIRSLAAGLGRSQVAIDRA
jgi:hypothetical protein